MFFAVISLAVAAANPPKRSVICIIMPANSPTFPPNIVNKPATDPIAKLAVLAFAANAEILFVVCAVALARPSCLAISILSSLPCSTS